MRDHSPLTITSFQGTYDRGEEETCPVGYFQNSQNIRFIKGGVSTRYGIRKEFTLGSVRRAAVYKRIGEATRILILDNSGHLYDSTNLSTPILSIATMIDFSMVTMFNRAYITPHNGITGLPGEKVYVYEGTGTAVGVAGNGPSNTLVVAESPTSGNVEEGLRAYAVAFETNSGFVTKPGGFTTCQSTGGFSVDVSNIEIGGARVVARHILATKRIVDFNGNFQDQTYYFVFRIPDNTTTECSLSFYDADLQSDATYLLEQLGEIPAGVGITSYAGKLIVWGEDAYSSIGRVSVNAQPESFNEVEGFFTVNPGIGGGIKNCWEYRTQLVVQKSQHTYMTQDNGETAAFWPVTAIDMSIGTECHGVAKSMDFGENMADRVFTVDRSGLRLFDGTFSGAVLTYVIDDIWSRINQAYFHTIEIVIDPINYQIFIAVPLDGATTPNTLLYGDYIEGLSEDAIRWTIWDFPYDPTTVIVDLVNNVPIFKFGSLSGNIYELDPTLILDDGQAIDQSFEFPYMPGDGDDIVNHFTGVKLRIRGIGSPHITLSGLDRVNTLFTQQPTLAMTPGVPFFIGFNFSTERCAVKFHFDTAGDFFILTKFILYIVGLWEERPIG